MKSIKEKSVEYAKTKHTNQNLIEIVSWDFEAGANYVLEEIEKCYEKDDSLCAISHKIISKIQQLKGE